MSTFDMVFMNINFIDKTGYSIHIIVKQNTE